MTSRSVNLWPPTFEKQMMIQKGYSLPLQWPQQWHCHRWLWHASPHPFPTLCSSFYRAKFLHSPNCQLTPSPILSYPHRHGTSVDIWSAVWLLQRAYTNEKQAHYSLSARPSSSMFSAANPPPRADNTTALAQQNAHPKIEFQGPCFRWSLYPMSCRPQSASSSYHPGVFTRPSADTNTTNMLSHIDLSDRTRVLERSGTTPDRNQGRKQVELLCCCCELSEHAR